MHDYSLKRIYTLVVFYNNSYTPKPGLKFEKSI